ncbi:hypothetical protein [Amycolatopsis sp. lyj-346]|uniref:hypothetical protein n=1 Tax=Amycolatopsis sp. lyj-346 TaxID=2789289 RepID=UPI00397990CC
MPGDHARRTTPDTPARPRWEWHLFEADGWAHLYSVAELADSRLELLRPRCLQDAPFPLEHDRPSIDRRRLRAPGRGWTCPACAPTPHRACAAKAP